MAICKAHELFQARVSGWLQQQGYRVCEATYHEVMDEGTKGLLQRRHTPTALYIRTRADRIAIHEQRAVEFEFECKTHSEKSRLHDMMVEALPLAHHVSKSRLGVRCLYAYTDPGAGVECGFWTDQLPQIAAVYVPDRWDREQREWFKAVFRSWFPVEPKTTVWRAGSGDPMVKIDESVVRALPHWKDLIAGRCGAGDSIWAIPAPPVALGESRPRGHAPRAEVLDGSPSDGFLRHLEAIRE